MTTAEKETTMPQAATEVGFGETGLRITSEPLTADARAAKAGLAAQSTLDEEGAAKLKESEDAANKTRGPPGSSDDKQQHPHFKSIASDSSDEELPAGHHTNAKSTPRTNPKKKAQLV